MIETTETSAAERIRADAQAKLDALHAARVRVDGLTDHVADLDRKISAGPGAIESLSAMLSNAGRTRRELIGSVGRKVVARGRLDVARLGEAFQHALILDLHRDQLLAAATETLADLKLQFKAAKDELVAAEKGLADLSR